MGKLALTAEQLMTVPEPGTIEFNGTAAFHTPQGLQRGVVPSMQYYVTNESIAGANSTAAQNILGVGVTLSSNTVYAFQGNFNFFKTAGTTSHNFRYQWGGTATFNSIVTNIYFYDGNLGFVTPTRAMETLTMETVGPTTLGSITTAFYTLNLLISGIVSVDQGGTLIPQYSLSAAPGGGYTSVRSNNMSIWPIGTAGGTATSVGTWA
jgi:hypothetical protein